MCVLGDTISLAIAVLLLVVPSMVVQHVEGVDKCYKNVNEFSTSPMPCLPNERLFCYNALCADATQHFFAGCAPSGVKDRETMCEILANNCTIYGGLKKCAVCNSGDGCNEFMHPKDDMPKGPEGDLPKEPNGEMPKEPNGNMTKEPKEEKPTPNEDKPAPNEEKPTPNKNNGGNTAAGTFSMLLMNGGILLAFLVKKMLVD